MAAPAQPLPSAAGITKRMVRVHARRIFRDKWHKRPLTLAEWHLAEEDLLRMLEAEGL